VFLNNNNKPNQSESDGNQFGFNKELKEFNQGNTENSNEFIRDQKNTFPNMTNISNVTPFFPSSYSGSGGGFNPGGDFNPYQQQQQPYYYPNMYKQPNFYSQPKNNFYQQQNQFDENSFQNSLKYVNEKYPDLMKINQSFTGITQRIQAQSQPKFYVIKSFTEEDIHKSIKYGVWSSTREGNKKLTNAYIDCKKKNSDVFLFFSMNGSGRFVGIARMISEVDENMIFEYWAMDDVWKGLFKVEWLLIKDVPNKFFKEIKLSNNGFKPVTNSRDTQEIPRAEGELMVNIFEEFKNQTNLLQHFQYYDERQSMFDQTKQQK